MIDWTKPLETTDGVPVWLAEKGFAEGPNPDGDGDYWIEGPNGLRECVGPEGENNSIQIRNRLDPLDNLPPVSGAGCRRATRREMGLPEIPNLRDRFAMAALTGLLATSDLETEEAALLAYKAADAMLAARGDV